MNQSIRQIFTTLRSPLIKNLVIFSLGSLMLRGISIFLAPITMNILEPQDYGLSALAYSFVSVFTVFIGLGLRQVFSMEYFHCSSTQKKIMLNSMIMVYLLVATPLIIIACLNISTINQLIFMGSAPRALIFLSLAHSFLYFFVEFFYQVLSYKAQALRITLIQTSIALLTIGLNLLFLCWLRWGVISMMAGNVIGLVVILGVGLYSYIATSCHLHFNFRCSLVSCKNYIKLGLPFIPGTLCGWILASSDRWVLAQYASLNDVGIYSLAAIFGQVFNVFIIIPMASAYVPHVLKKFADNKNNVLMVERWNQRNMLYSMIGLSVIVTAGYFVCKPILYLVLPLRYQPAINYIWVILMGNIFWLGEHFASIFVIFNKQAYFQAASLIVPSGINISLNLLLVPHLRITGCVIASMIAYIAYFVIKLLYNHYLQRKISAQNRSDISLSSTLLDKTYHELPMPQQKVPEHSTSRQQL